ncbi:MAG TPA: TIGR04282 family arsenosugar biosynthesis glycosyltransferase [Xanthobacteraceae bacterium]
MIGARTNDRSADGSCGIAVMAKASIPGKAKTRLVPPLSLEEAAAFNTAFLKDVAANIAAAGEGVACYMAYGPPGSHDFFTANLPAGVGLIESWHANFGDCLFVAIEQVLARGHGSAVVLNSDSPTLPTALLVETARLLAQPGDRAVLGPSSDGGYYLLGLKAPHRRMFADVAWSTEHVARQTRERAAEIGLELHVLPEWYDVDDLASLQMLHDELFGRRAFSRRLPSHAAAHSTALLDELLTRSDLARRLDRGDAAARRAIG